MLEAARIGPDEIAAELGGLGPSHRHAAVLAADALHRALSGLAGSGPALAEPPSDGGSASWSPSAAGSTPPSPRCGSARRGARWSR